MNDDIIEETTDETEDTIEQVEAEELHSNYKVPALSDSTIKFHLTGMYQEWFLDYASYVILERAVPDVYDGLKPVQRRILHSMKRLDDGRYNKVANIVGHTMQFHPHGDASIGDALVQLGQKELLIDCQGNWGNILTGDGAAASRYIEARLSKFALDVLFNPKTTHWKLSYDGRNKEPITLPVKFPLLLAQGVEGIAVGLNSKILPHNFNELCQAAIAHLKGEAFVLYPDFQTGGSIDVSRYNDGERGGAVKIRSKISKVDNKTLVISEVPYGSNAGKLIDSIIRANEKGKIKVRKVDDNTSANVEILVHLQPGSSSDKTIDALYAFTDCEMSISPNCCVIKDKKPIFTNVSNMLRITTNHTKELLKWELEIQQHELKDQFFFVSLEKIFIEERIYKDKEFEESRSADEAIQHIDSRLGPFKPTFIREVKREDLLRLLEIKMMRITKFDSDKANDLLANLQAKIDEVEHHLAHLVDYTIRWFETLQKRYGANYPRRTELRNFENIVAAKVVEANEKLYINREEGFIGTGLKKDEFVCNCSDIDDVILFYKDGKYKIVRVSDKLFVGTNVLHVDVFKKNDKRTIYNVVYRDGKRGFYYMKRFAVTGITRDKEYDLTQGKVGSRLLYFTANPNGEAEVIRVALKENSKLKRKEIIKDLSELTVKGRQSMGNLLTKFEINRITLKQKGGSTLGGRKVWFDHDVLRLNYDGRGDFLGEFHSEDLILVVTKTGTYFTTGFEVTNHYENNIYRIEKFSSEKVWSLALWDADQRFYYLKRFVLEASVKSLSLTGDNQESCMVVLSDREKALFEVTFGETDAWREKLLIDAEEFIGTKSYKAKGKRISTHAIATITDVTPEPEPTPDELDLDDENGQEIEMLVAEGDTITDDDAVEELAEEGIEKEEEAAPESEEEALTEENSSVVGLPIDIPAAAKTAKMATKSKRREAKDIEKEKNHSDRGGSVIAVDTPAESVQPSPSDEIPMEIEATMPEDSLPATKETEKAKAPKRSKKKGDEESMMTLF